MVSNETIHFCWQMTLPPDLFYLHPAAQRPGPRNSSWFKDPAKSCILLEIMSCCQDMPRHDMIYRRILVIIYIYTVNKYTCIYILYILYIYIHVCMSLSLSIAIQHTHVCVCVFIYSFIYLLNSEAETNIRRNLRPSPPSPPKRSLPLWRGRAGGDKTNLSNSTFFCLETLG